ncbi:MAG: hypothetical protein ACJ768_19515 [Gaiellaceae bacterium]
MKLTEFRGIVRNVLQKHEREVETRRTLSALRRFAERNPSPERAARISELEQQLEHDGALTDAAIEEIFLEFAAHFDPGGFSQ